jgi:hypothetical protein
VVIPDRTNSRRLYIIGAVVASAGVPSLTGIQQPPALACADGGKEDPNMNLFRSNAPADATPADARVDDARRDAAFAKGEAKGQRDALAGDAQATDRATLNERNTVVRHAYDRGRRDERARRPRRHGSPFMTLIVLLAAVAGVGAIYLGVHEGSFTRGGQVVDQKLAGVAQPAQQATKNAADRAGDALENAGQRIKQSAGADNTNGAGG